MSSFNASEILEQSTGKVFDFAHRLMQSVRSFLEVHDLMDSIKANDIDEITLAGMAASFQIREWERMGILAHMPFHPILYRQVCNNVAALSDAYNTEHLKSIALLLDVTNYYLANFTQLAQLKTAKASSLSSAAHSSLWKLGALAELNPNRLTLPAPLPAADIPTIPEVGASKAPKRSRTRDNTDRTWSEKEAAEYSGYSPSTMKRMRADGEIPTALYHQRAKGGKIRYYPEAYKAWFEQRQKK